MPKSLQKYVQIMHFVNLGHFQTFHNVLNRFEKMSEKVPKTKIKSGHFRAKVLLSEFRFARIYVTREGSSLERRVFF